MLKQLVINNIAIIEEAVVEFDDGFNVLTGETAAGKSIIIDSINMVLGERGSRDKIRGGQDKATVSAMFCVDNPEILNYIDSMGLSCDGDILLRREICADGKSNSRFNGQIITNSMMRDIAKRLVNIHGQHDNQALLVVSNHIGFLDKFANVDLARYRIVYDERKELLAALGELNIDEQEKARRIQLLTYQIEEIRVANLSLGEEEELLKKRGVLANSARIFEAVNSCYNALYGDEGAAHDSVARAVRSLDTVSGYDNKLEKLCEALNGASAVLDDVANSVRNYSEELDTDAAARDAVEARLDLIYGLKRKYGNTIEDILTFCERAEKDISDILNVEERQRELEQMLADNLRILGSLSIDIGNTRRKCGEALDERITQELVDLGMVNSNFKVAINPCDFNKNGADDVEFMIVTNLGEQMKSLGKIASGGELSRIMLAIKSILADTDVVGTLVFDEIDAGLSGRAAQKTAEKIAQISQKKQVLAITHLAQIAAMSDRHLRILKSDTIEGTRTQVHLLDDAGREEELARIIGGAVITDTTMRSAREMLDFAGKV